MRDCLSGMPQFGSAVTEATHFRGYRLEPVFQASSAEQRSEAVTFWLAQGAIAQRQEALRRAFELVYLVRRSDGRLAGMSTVALQTGANGHTFYAYRMFLRPEDRVPYLMRTITNASRDLLREFVAPDPKPAGMLIVTENPKLMRAGMARYLERHGYLYRGKNLRGLDRWWAPFSPHPREEATGKRE